MYKLVPLRPGSENCGTKRQNQLKQSEDTMETRKTKLMVRKYKKFANFLKEKTHKASMKPTTVNCNHRKLLKEISPGEVQIQHAQINYKSTCDNKCETTRAKETL